MTSRGRTLRTSLATFFFLPEQSSVSHWFGSQQTTFCAPLPVSITCERKMFGSTFSIFFLSLFVGLLPAEHHFSEEIMLNERIASSSFSPARHLTSIVMAYKSHVVDIKNWKHSCTRLAGLWVRRFPPKTLPDSDIEWNIVVKAEALLSHGAEEMSPSVCDRKIMMLCHNTLPLTAHTKN